MSKFVLPPRLADAELKKFVRDYLAGKIYTNFDIPDDLLTRVFLPLALGAPCGISKKQSRQLGCIYGTLGEDRGTTLAINGFPIFFSFRMMLAEDWKIARATIIREQAARAEFKLERP